MTGEQAWEISKWCSETAEKIRDIGSDRDARKWWETEADVPRELKSALGSREDMASFADRLQAEGYEWASASGERYAQEDQVG